ncbi:hypothetical protein HYDPIDRAFT_120736 [Hydnomerulius pinastri MD-312]|nr:hypothetical protein HYDPIDRAFT_120736 [Hydnomerulius pinastri MD-312]
MGHLRQRPVETHIKASDEPGVLAPLRFSALTHFRGLRGHEAPLRCYCPRVCRCIQRWSDDRTGVSNERCSSEKRQKLHSTSHPAHFNGLVHSSWNSTRCRQLHQWSVSAASVSARQCLVRGPMEPSDPEAWRILPEFHVAGPAVHGNGTRHFHTHTPVLAWGRSIPLSRI